MSSDTNLFHQPNIFQQQSPRAFKLLQPLTLLGAVFFITFVAGASGYVLGMKNRQSISALQPSQTPILSFPILPTIEDYSPATTHWKTYVNARWGLSFKYPETWFPQEAPQSSQRGDAVGFYQYGVTPYPGGGGDDPSNNVFSVENREGHSPQTNERFISEARQTDGNRVLNVAGKPAIRGDGYRGESYYTIKLSSTRELVLAAYNEEEVKRLDIIVSTIKFAEK